MQFCTLVFRSLLCLVINQLVRAKKRSYTLMNTYQEQTQQTTLVHNSIEVIAASVTRIHTHLDRRSKQNVEANKKMYLNKLMNSTPWQSQVLFLKEKTNLPH